MTSGIRCHRVVIGLGSNSGDRYVNVSNASEWLAGLLDGFKCSAVYETAALNPSDPDYCNAVASGLTQHSPDALVEEMKRYERRCGRMPGKIVIDLDLVMYDGDILRPDDFSRSYFILGYDMIR